MLWGLLIKDFVRGILGVLFSMLIGMLLGVFGFDSGKW